MSTSPHTSYLHSFQHLYSPLLTASAEESESESDKVRECKIIAVIRQEALCIVIRQSKKYLCINTTLNDNLAPPQFHEVQYLRKFTKLCEIISCFLIFHLPPSFLFSLIHGCSMHLMLYHDAFSHDKIEETSLTQLTD